MENAAEWVISAGSAGSPAAWMAAWKPCSRSRPVEVSCGPATQAIRRCPSPARWPTASRIPRSLSTDTEGKLNSSDSRLTSTTSRPACAAAASTRLCTVAVASTKPSTCRARISSKTICSRSSSESVLPISATYPSAASRSSRPRTIGGNSGFVRSGMSTPMVCDRRVRSDRATVFGR